MLVISDINYIFTVILKKLAITEKQLTKDHFQQPLTSFMTCRTAGVSGVYSSFPINRGFIPRHTMRDRGLDSRPRIKLLQNGAAWKKKTKKQKHD